jgi:alkanesulfonate monooxygenase SsuD/methylene tetrahydromethanopterin reductase-like flavin-dependent oxidoreductase (luciferase family)
MQYGIFLPNFGPFGDAGVLADLASRAEECGWDGIFIWDHILFQEHPPEDVVDPWVALTAMALSTNRVRLGALMTPVARRRPWKLARETVSVDRLSHGRLVFGAGLGFPPRAEFELYGEDADDRVRAQKLDEGLAVLTGLWTGEPFSFHGQQFTIEETTFLPRPAQQPRPPVWIAGWWPNKPPYRRAARWDGVYPELVGGGLPSPQQLEEVLEYIGEHRTSSGHFDVVLNGYGPADPAAAAEFLEPYRERGLTWWLERVDPDRLYDVDETRARLEAGPPAPS